MAISSERITVTTSAVALNPVSIAGQRLYIANGAAIIDVGGSTVASGAGYSVGTAGTLVVDVKPGDQLFAITATSSSVQVLRT